MNRLRRMHALFAHLCDSARSWRLWVAPVALLSTIGAIVLAPSPARADAWFDPLPDRGEHYWCYDDRFGMSPGVSDRAEWVMNNIDGVEAQTVVNTEFLSTCPASIDVRYQQVTSLAVGTYGRVLCNGLHDNGQCDRFDTRIDWDNILDDADIDNKLYQARKVLCHEVGHTMGARHYSGATNNPDGDNALQSCMLSGIADSGADWTRQYGPHHINSHFNVWF